MKSEITQNQIKKLTYSAITGNLTYVSTITLDASFSKTTNCAVKSGWLYTLISGVYKKFNLSTGAVSTICTFPASAGQLFSFNNAVYFGSGEVAKKLI